MITNFAIGSPPTPPLPVNPECAYQVEIPSGAYQCMTTAQYTSWNQQQQLPDTIEYVIVGGIFLAGVIGLCILFMKNNRQ